MEVGVEIDPVPESLDGRYDAGRKRAPVLLPPTLGSVRTPDPSKLALRIAAVEITLVPLLDYRPEKTVLPLETGQHHGDDRVSLERRDEDRGERENQARKRQQPVTLSAEMENARVRTQTGFSDLGDQSAC